MVKISKFFKKKKKKKDLRVPPVSKVFKTTLLELNCMEN